MKNKTKRTLGQHELQVTDSQVITPNMQRVTFSCERFDDIELDPLLFGPHLKLMIPYKGQEEIIWPTFDREKHSVIWPEGTDRPSMRTYSVRRFDRESQRLTIDFVRHEGGAASTWAQQAKAGDKIGLKGPGGLHTYHGQWLVLIGDISALPAISYTLENLPDDAQGKAIIELDDAQDRVEVSHPRGVEIIWLIREAGQSSTLAQTLATLAIPAEARPFIWGGAESSIARDIRRSAKDKLLLCRDCFQIINYWRIGVAEGAFNHSGD